MSNKKIKIMITLGPSTRTEGDLKKIKAKGVDFVRVNMSHSSLEDLKYFINLSKKIGIPFVVDTQGSQIRTGNLSTDSIHFKKADEIKICSSSIMGNKVRVCLRPGGHIVNQLGQGDLIHIDFDALTLRVSDVSTIKNGYIIARATADGILLQNKGAVVVSASNKKIDPVPTLSEKDRQAIKIGLDAGMKYIAASFMRNGEAVDEVREATKNSMKIISKIECRDALNNLDEIIERSDFLLIDRGDLSKEIPLEKIPFAQKTIIQRASLKNKGVFVATNLLETMVEKRWPTRAEAHDVVATILDGASGLVLAAETAIGKYPMESIDILNKLKRECELKGVENPWEK